MEIINIETPRLRLRAFTMEDFDALWEIFGDPVVMEHVAPYTEEETRELLRTFCVERDPPGACAAVRKEDGRLIGYLLCKQIDEPGIYELGWIFRRDVWRQGYAYEAVSALMDHLFRVREVHKVMAETEDAVRSLGLMKKLGLVMCACNTSAGLAETGKSWVLQTSLSTQSARLQVQ